MWESKKINLGVIKEYQKIKIHFKTLEDIKDNINYIRPCCGSCTTVQSVDSTGITVLFDVGEIPIHLNNIWDIEKCVVVVYKDSSTDTLTFKGKVKR